MFLVQNLKDFIIGLAGEHFMIMDQPEMVLAGSSAQGVKLNTLSSIVLSIQFRELTASLLFTAYFTQNLLKMKMGHVESK